jgi:hypothetical protein
MIQSKIRVHLPGPSFRSTGGKNPPPNQLHYPSTHEANCWPIVGLVCARKSSGSALALVILSGDEPRDEILSEFSPVSFTS